MTKTLTEIKREMALPPIPQPAHKDRHGRDRDRNRIRLEISVPQCEVFVAMLRERLTAYGPEHPEFQSLYAVYFSLRSQATKFNKKEILNG